MAKDLPALAHHLPAVALLVDGENMSNRHAPALLKLADQFGTPVVRRVYGKVEHIADWAEHGFRLQATRPGKNAADLLLSVEATILALKDRFETILVASSDRDFSYLAEQLRELGHHFVGIGEAKAPTAFRLACSRFVELAPMAVLAKSKAVERPEVVVKAVVAPDQKLPITKIIPLVRSILPKSSLKDGWAYVDWIEKTLCAGNPAFSAAQYGHESFDGLVRAVNFFEFEKTANGRDRLRDRTDKAAKVQPATP